MINRKRETGRPRLFASSSERESALSFQRRAQITSEPMTTNGRPSFKDFQSAPVKEPISQNVTAGSSSCGSAANFTRLMRELKRAATTRPERMSIRIELLPCMSESCQTPNTAAKPTMSDSVCTPKASNPKRMPSTAPNAAPVETPSVSAVARGLEKRA